MHRFGKHKRKHTTLSRTGEIRPTWYEMPRARARRCALKTTDRRPLARTTARVTGAFSGTKRENGARAASIRKSYKHELRETAKFRRSRGGGAVAAYGIRRRRPASSDGGRLSGRGDEAEARSGGAAASPGCTIRSRSGERGVGARLYFPVGDAGRRDGAR